MKVFLKSGKAKLLAIGVLVAALVMSFSPINIEIVPKGSNPLSIGQGQLSLRIGNPAYATGFLDYVTDGVNDNVEWAQLFAVLSSHGGGVAYSVSSNFSFGSAVTVPANVIVIGSGTGFTFNRDGINPIFTASSNDTFKDVKTDAGGIALASDTVLNNVHLGTTFYADASTGTANFTTVNAPTGRAATFIVAANDAQSIEKAQADYICDGVADDIQINAAISALPANGGVVQLTDGVFNITLPIFLTVNSTIRGSSSSVIRVGNSVNTTLSVNAVAGQFTVTVTSTSGFLPGMDVTLFDNAHTGYGGGESNQIVSVNSSTKVIQLSRALAYSYQVAQNAIIFSAYNAIDATNIRNVTIENITIDGNKANNSVGNYDEYQNGIHLVNSHNSRVMNNIIYNAVMVGIEVSHVANGNGAANVTISGNQAYGNILDAFRADDIINSIISGNRFSDGSAGVVLVGRGIHNTYTNNIIIGGAASMQFNAETRSTISMNTANGSSGKGIYLTVSGGSTSNGNTVTGNTVSYTTNDGIYVQGSYNTVTGNTDYHAGEVGIDIVLGSYNSITNNVVYGGVGGNDILINQSDHFVIVGNNTLKTSGGDVSISVSGSVTGVITANNAVKTNGDTISISAPTTAIVRGNYGYVTENSGTANITAGNGSINVTHGLVATPLRISLTIAGNPGLVTSVYSGNISSTQFTIFATANFTNNTAIYWRAATRDGN